VGQIALVITQFDLIGFTTFHTGRYSVFGDNQMPDRADGKISFAALEGRRTGKFCESSAADQLI
jgi:hypothetical protein